MQIMTYKMRELVTMTVRQIGYSEERVFNIPYFTTSFAALGKKLCCKHACIEMLYKREISGSH